MHSVNLYKFACCLTGILTLSCGRKTNVEDLPPIKIEARGNFDVAVGQDVEWKFKAMRDGRDMKIIDVSAARIPFGVVPIYEPGNLGYRGKIMGRQFRGGLIKITAFDSKLCEQEYDNMKKLVEKNVKETKSTEVSIPVNPCSGSLSARDPNMEQFLSDGYFYWYLTDGPDSMTAENYKNVIESMACEAADDCKNVDDIKKLSKPVASGKKNSNAPKIKSRDLSLPGTFAVIPPKEAPHTFDVSLGECTRFEREQCGHDKSCLWNRAACISGDYTGHTAIKEESP